MIFILWCIAGLIHLTITGYLAFAFSRYRFGTNDHTPKFSIVIAAHNEEENLKKLGITKIILHEELCYDSLDHQQINLVRKHNYSTIDVIEASVIPLP